VSTFCQNGTQRREVLLSFDDGPHPENTPKLLDVLGNHGIKAMFFVEGQKLAKPFGTEILRRIASEGHYVGNHSYTHLDLTKLADREIREELTRTEALIGDADRGIKLLRPPYGSCNRLVSHVAHDLGYQLVFWNVDTLDCDPRFQPGGWVQHGLNQIKEREHSLVLAHDFHPTTVGKAEEFITAIKAIPNVQFSTSRRSVRKLVASIRYPMDNGGPCPSIVDRCIAKVRILFLRYR